MKTVKMLISFLFFSSICVLADDLKLADGQVYKDFSVSAVNENGVVISFAGDKMATVPFAEWPAAQRNQLGRFQAEFDRLSKTVSAPTVAPVTITGSPKGGKSASEQAKEKEKQMAEVMAQGVMVYIRDASLKNVRGIVERHYDKTGCGLTDGKFIVINNNLFLYDKDKVQALDKMIDELQSKQKAAAANVEKINKQIDDCKKQRDEINSRRDGRQTVKKGDTTSTQWVMSDAQKAQIDRLNNRISELKDNMRDEKKKVSQYAGDLKNFQESSQALERTRKKMCDKYSLPIKPVDLF